MMWMVALFLSFILELIKQWKTNDFLREALESGVNLAAYSREIDEEINAISRDSVEECTHPF